MARGGRSQTIILRRRYGAWIWLGLGSVAVRHGVDSAPLRLFQGPATLGKGSWNDNGKIVGVAAENACECMV